MGGSAFLIYGDFDPARAAAVSPRSFLDRLRKREPPAVTTTPFPNGRSLLQFPADAVQPLAGDYLTFVRDRLTAPWAASRVVLDYLQLGQPTVYLRADRNPGEASGPALSGAEGPWYVQLSFSGCAGMCETSARVAAHWASHWYAARGDELRTTVLSPAAFTALRAESLADAVFVPTRECGYAEPESEKLAVDASFLESHADGEARLGQLEQEHGRQLSDGKCHCEMCQKQ